MSNLFKRSKLQKNSVVTARIKKVLIAMVSTLLIGGGYLFWNESNHPRPDFEQLEREIAAANIKANGLKAVLVLPDIKTQWTQAEEMALAQGVELEALSPDSPYGINLGFIDGGHIWQGVLKGDIDDVLFVGMTIQEEMRAVLGDIAFSDGNGVMTIGIIGASPKRLNTRQNQLNIRKMTN